MNVAVLGAGPEGRDVASLCACAGHHVSIHADDATKAMDRIDDIERAIVDAGAAGEISESKEADAIDALEATTDLEAAVSDSDVVIETTITESEQLQERFAEIESVVDRKCLITTSTPDVSLTTAAAGLRQPDRGLGFDFLSLPETPVVAILIAEQSTAQPAAHAESFVKSLEATPVRVRDTVGVASTRLALALEAEAMRLVADGIADVEGVDTLLRQGREFPEGPLERADRAGLDSRLETLERLATAVGPRFEPPDVLHRLVEAGKTGVDVGEGFYRWESGEPVESALEGPALPARDDQPDDPANR